MGNVQKHNNDINIPSWQTFRSYYDKISLNSKTWIYGFSFTYLLIYMSDNSAYCKADAIELRADSAAESAAESAKTAPCVISLKATPVSTGFLFTIWNACNAKISTG
jgi:hypothetical protein